MQLRLWCILFVLFASTSCEHGPRVTVCLVDSERQSLQCSDADGKTFELPLKEGENYVCMPPRDAERLLKMLKDSQSGCLPVLAP